ncbi:MAG: Flp pilus assembly protein CpaB [Bacillota bacterium]
MAKSRLWFVITLLFAILTGLLVFRYLTGAQTAAVDEVMATQVVARVKIPTGTRISADMLETVEVPVKYAHPSAATDLEFVVNRFALIDLLPGEPVPTNRIASEKTVNELPYKIPPGFRAMTVPVNALSGVAGLLKPGHYVDVLVTYSGPDPVLDAKAVTLVQNALVLAVGSELQKIEGVQVSENVTLALRPSDAQLVAFGESIGRIKLAARPVGEDDAPVPRYMDVARMLGLYP